MAFMSQDNKRRIAALVKPILKKYGMKGTLGVHNHSTLVLNLKSGPIDFIGNCRKVTENDPCYSHNPVVSNETHQSVNIYHYRNQYSGVAKEFLSKVIPILNTGNHDRSDIMTDYFDVGFFISFNVGKWNKPYILTK